MTTINFYIQFSVECHGIKHAYGVTACITGISSVYKFASVMASMLQNGTAKRIALVGCCRLVPGLRFRGRDNGGVIKKVISVLLNLNIQ